MAAPAGHDTNEAAVCASVPPLTARRLRLYVELLHRWQPTVNLVSPASLTQVWTRHIADSLQVGAAVPTARRWLDMGSGAGFPGVVTAIALAGRPGAHVHLVESDKRKAAFLRTVSREMGVPATVHAERMDAFAAWFDEPVDAVSARALAPLASLVTLAEKFLWAGAIGVFPKGEGAAAELTAAGADRRFRFASVPSRTEATARLVIVTRARPGVEA